MSGGQAAPMAATSTWYAEAGIKQIQVTTPHAVTVPGAIDGWATLLRDHGTMSLADVLAPAVDAAENSRLAAWADAAQREREGGRLLGGFDHMFELGDPPDYEPTAGGLHTLLDSLFRTTPPTGRSHSVWLAGRPVMLPENTVMP